MTPRTVIRRLHPLEGQTLRVLGTMSRRGQDELLVVLEDGSKTLIPSAWTDLCEEGGDANTTKPTATLGALDDLLAASRLARARSPRSEPTRAQAARKPPTKEDDRAPCAAESAARLGPGASTDGAGRAARSRRRRGDQPARRSHRQSLEGRSGRGDDARGGGARR